VKLSITNGYRTTYWELGEFEVYGALSPGGAPAKTKAAVAAEAPKATLALRTPRLVDAMDGAGVVLQWPSAEGRRYTVQRSESLPSGFTSLWLHLPATPPLNVYTDATATGGGPYFYRIRQE